jgi:hypothetical protein
VTEIGKTAWSPTPERAISTSNSATEQRSISEDNVVPADTQVESDISTQDSAVSISPEGAAMAREQANGNQGDAPHVSAIKSLAYGTLGLERPDEPQENRNEFYTAGRLAAAGITAIGIVAIFV